MKQLKTLGYFLGFIWCSPISTFIWIWMGTLFLMGKIDRVKICPNLSIIWDVAEGSWLYRMTKGRGWYGFATGNNIIVYSADLKYSKQLKHEDTHVIQNYILGVFFLPVYFIIQLFIFVFMPDKQSYIDHPFERQARRKAGQKMEYTREEWPFGPDNRWY